MRRYPAGFLWLFTLFPASSPMGVAVGPSSAPAFNPPICYSSRHILLTLTDRVGPKPCVPQPNVSQGLARGAANRD